jgi:hypothetical protein
MQIPGTQRKEVPEVEQAGEAFREVRDERRALKEKETQKKHELITIMRAHKVRVYKYKDHDGDEIRVELGDGDPKIKLKKTAEAEREVGGGGGGHSAPAEREVHRGLIDQALKSQAEANVEENAAGDVVVPETSAPKGKRGKGRKAK